MLFTLKISPTAAAAAPETDQCLPGNSRRTQQKKYWASLTKSGLITSSGQIITMKIFFDLCSCKTPMQVIQYRMKSKHHANGYVRHGQYEQPRRWSL